jgi:hypothetical protein
MTMDTLTILMVISLGVLSGTGAGLIIGYCAKTQKPDWREMSRNEILINLALVVLCSLICTGGLVWYLYR